MLTDILLHKTVAMTNKWIVNYQLGFFVVKTFLYRGTIHKIFADMIILLQECFMLNWDTLIKVGQSPPIIRDLAANLQPVFNLKECILFYKNK